MDMGYTLFPFHHSSNSEGIKLSAQPDLGFLYRYTVSKVSIYSLSQERRSYLDCALVQSDTDKR